MQYINSPIIVSYNPGTFSKEATMTQVVFIVSCNGREYPFPQEAKDNETVYCDISSALRSAMFCNRYPEETSVPTAPYTVKAAKKQFLAGEEQTLATEGIASGTATYGSLTELERKQGTSFANRSTKPTTGERYPAGHVSLSCTDTAITHTTRETATSDLPMVEFRFVNQRGAIEDAVCVTRQALSYNHKQRNRYTNVGMPSAPQAVSIRNTRTKIRPSWKLSSGYVTREWAEWYAAELLASDNVWINLGTPSSPSWQPCVLTPEENVLVFDESNPDALHIDFTCELALEGRVV